MINLQLYVSGHSRTSEKVVKNLKTFLDSQYSDQYILDIIDVLEHPEKASSENILATPTLVKSKPEPPRKIIGDFSAHKELEYILGL